MGADFAQPLWFALPEIVSDGAAEGERAGDTPVSSNNPAPFIGEPKSISTGLVSTICLTASACNCNQSAHF
jgi:hypothetical protein